MIKIIEEGTTHKRRCESCGCLFLFEDEDINICIGVGVCGMELYKKPYGLITCPLCKNKIMLNLDD